nr:aromatic ring-hydroxylating dioxygenase subunit alpha [Sphingomonas sp. CDS-1]
MDAEAASRIDAPHDENIEVCRALAQHVNARSTDLGEHSSLISPNFYFDPIRDEAEKLNIFGKMPMLAGLSKDIPNPGDTLLFDLVGPSIMVVRAKDGSVNAFLNMCMHRAAKLVNECGHHARFTCPFHAWTFDLQGKLIGVPRKDAFDPEHMENRNLVRVPIGEWGGMIFVKPHAGDERIDVEAMLGEFAPIVSLFALENAHKVAEGRLDFDANWKYALDTYCEGYHVGFLHSKTVGALYLGDLIKYDAFGRNHRIAFAPNAYQATMGKAEEEWPIIPYSPTYYIFPNIAINIQPMEQGGSFVSVHRIFPGETVGKGFSILGTYKLDGAPTDEDRHHYEAAHELIMKVVGTEDYSVSAGGYNNLKHAPAGFRSVIGRNELGVQNVHRHLAEEAGMPL